MTLTPEEMLAQADADHDLEAWYMDESKDDQRKEHRCARLLVSAVMTCAVDAAGCAVVSTRS